MNKFQILTFLFLLSNFAYPHGEESPGPHGGYIRMPGAFHIELVPVSKERLQFYLLDMEFKNPTIEKSNIQAKWIKGGSEKNLICVTKKDRFDCLIPKELGLKKFTQIAVQATRLEQKGVAIKYVYPFEHASSHAQDEENSDQ